MQIESKELKELLIKHKQESLQMLDRGGKNKVKNIIEARISVIDYILIWLDKLTKGDTTMAELKLGELTTWQPSPREGGIDEKIINDAKLLKKNGAAIKVTVETINWTTFANRTYVLRQNNKIDDHIVPRKDKEGNAYLVYLDNPNPKRSKGKA